MDHHKKIISVIFSLLLIGLSNSVIAGLLTPLANKTWVQVEITALQYRVAEMQQRLDNRTNINATVPDTSALDAVYKAFNTNFMEHLRYGDAHKKEINGWLEQNTEQKLTLVQLKSQMDRLSSQLESNEFNQN